MEHTETDEVQEIDGDQPQPPHPQPGDPYTAHMMQTLNRDHPSLTPVAAAAAAVASMGSDLYSPERHPQYGPELSCGRPFCKLKKKEHFHCHICNQAFSEQEKLKPHLLKHATCGPMNSSGFSAGSEEDADTSNEQGDDEDRNVQVKSESNSEHPGSPRSPSSIISSCFGGTTPSMSTSSPRPLGMGGISSNLSGPPTTPQFPPHIYTQAANFPGIASPFGPHLGMPGLFPGSLPRLLPPTAWQVHPTLAAMAHQGLMFPGMRPNGDMSHRSPGPGGLPGVAPGLGPGPGGAGMPGSGTDHNPLLSSSLGASPHLAMLGKRLGADDFNSQEAKKIRSNHPIRMLKDEPVPDGYIRFR